MTAVVVRSEVAAALEGLGSVRLREGLVLPHGLHSAASAPPATHHADALSAILAIHNYRSADF